MAGHCHGKGLVCFWGPAGSQRQTPADARGFRPKIRWKKYDEEDVMELDRDNYVNAKKNEFKLIEPFRREEEMTESGFSRRNRPRRSSLGTL